MPSDLTPTRLRALIAAATPPPWTVVTETERGCCGEDIGIEITIPEINRVLHSSEWADQEEWDRDLANAEFTAYLATHASTLAEALDAKELLEWLVFSDVSILRDGDKIAIVTDGSDPIVYLPWMDALRAAKEAADAE